MPDEKGFHRIAHRAGLPNVLGFSGEAFAWGGYLPGSLEPRHAAERRGFGRCKPWLGSAPAAVRGEAAARVDWQAR